MTATVTREFRYKFRVTESLRTYYFLKFLKFKQNSLTSQLCPAAYNFRDNHIKRNGLVA